MTARKCQRVDDNHSPESSASTDRTSLTIVKPEQASEEVSTSRRDACKDHKHSGEFEPDRLRSQIAISPGRKRFVATEKQSLHEMQNLLDEHESLRHERGHLRQEKQSELEELLERVTSLDRNPFAGHAWEEAPSPKPNQHQSKIRLAEHEQDLGHENSRRGRQHRYRREFRREQSHTEHALDQLRSFGQDYVMSDPDNGPGFGPSPDDGMDNLDDDEGSTPQSLGMVSREGRARAVQQVPPKPREGPLGLATAQKECPKRASVAPFEARSGRTALGGIASIQKSLPMQSSGPLTQQSVPAFLVLGAGGQTWVSPSGISSTVVELFDEQMSSLATKKQWRHFARLVQRSDRFTAGHCVQCDVIKHRKADCVFDSELQACNQCVSARRPCVRIIEVDDQMYIGWLPVPNSDAGWREKAYWIP